MTTEIQNPHAFPQPEFHDDGTLYVQHTGMSLRDYFAGQALAGYASQPVYVACGEKSRVVTARDAYAMADTMLAARSQVAA